VWRVIALRRGHLVVVECEDGRVLLGTVTAQLDGTLKVSTGLPGRAVYVHPDEVESLTLAERHPDVVGA
jgi:hypothetical protein